MVKPVREARWREAQQHELDFWKHWRTQPPYLSFDLERYWTRERARFDLPEGFFTGQRILDVGCGPVGWIHFVPEAGWRIRLAPPGMSVVATGERLPLASGVVDVAICFNALDHMQDPRAALADMARVLRPGGTLLMTHTFPGWTMALLAGDRLHPHHWTRQELLRQVAGPLRVV